MELIVAKNSNNVIGNNGALMWHISKDLRRFRTLTEHHIVVMGRKTYDSLPCGPLKNRINVIITRTPTTYSHESSDVYFVTLEDSFSLIHKLKDMYNKSVFIIGGSEIYRCFYNQCTVLHVTQVCDHQPGDTHFPISDNDIGLDFNLTHKETHHDEKTNVEYSFCTYEKTI
jgi:dihydrofolate reductase